MTRRERIRKYLFGELIPTPPDRWPDDDANLFAIGMDSVRVMRLLVFIEEELGVTIPEQSLAPEAIGKVQTLLELIEKHADA